MPLPTDPDAVPSPATTKGVPTASMDDTSAPTSLSYLPDGTAEVQPPQGEVTSTTLTRLGRIIGLDRAIVFTVLARGWSAIAAAITVYLLLRSLTPVQQGFYAVINPLVNIQIIFELGFSFVILQTASHESAHLQIAANGLITGPIYHRDRLSSILQTALRWYSIAAVALLCFLLIAGRWFFRGVAAHSTEHVAWLGPWILAAVAASFTFQVDPIFAFLEGCGFVPQVARARLAQFLTGSFLSIAALALHHGLYAPGAMLLGQALAGGVAIFHQRPLLGSVLRHRPTEHRTEFRTDIWPLQWRMAVSWVSGYLTVPLFAPMLAHLAAWGPVEAGRMGISISLAAKVGDVALAWMNTKAAPFGRLVALRQFAELDRRFLRSLLQSTTLGIFGAVTVWGLISFLARHGNHYGLRFLSPLGLALILFGYVANTVVSSMAIYLRAHKQEKFMVNSIAGAAYCLIALSVVAPRFGGLGVAAVYAAGSLVIGLGMGSYTFFKWRRIWHAAPVEQPA